MSTENHTPSPQTTSPDRAHTQPEAPLPDESMTDIAGGFISHGVPMSNKKKSKPPTEEE